MTKGRCFLGAVCRAAARPEPKDRAAGDSLLVRMGLLPSWTPLWLNSAMVELLLPHTDGGVIVQLLITALAGSTLLIILLRKGLHDAAWAAGGVVAMWTALMALRTLH